MTTNKLRGGSLTPAYGRDYKSAKAATADFLAGKDFVHNDHTGSGYANIDDYEPGCTVRLRYNHIRDVTVVKVPVKPA